jgi:hypothetical protein
VTTQQSSLNIVYLLFNVRQFTDFGGSDERFHVVGGNAAALLSAFKALNTGPKSEFA